MFRLLFLFLLTQQLSNAMEQNDLITVFFEQFTRHNEWPIQSKIYQSKSIKNHHLQVVLLNETNSVSDDSLLYIDNTMQNFPAIYWFR